MLHSDLRGDDRCGSSSIFCLRVEWDLSWYKAERNSKLHLIAAIIVIVAGLLTGFSQIEWLS